MTEQDYAVVAWQKEHKGRNRAMKRKWYYRRRRVVNLSFSRPTGPEMDIADFALDTERWNPFDVVI